MRRARIRVGTISGFTPLKSYLHRFPAQIASCIVVRYNVARSLERPTPRLPRSSKHLGAVPGPLLVHVERQIDVFPALGVRNRHRSGNLHCLPVLIPDSGRFLLRRPRASDSPTQPPPQTQAFAGHGTGRIAFTAAYAGRQLCGVAARLAKDLRAFSSSPASRCPSLLAD